MSLFCFRSKCKRIFSDFKLMMLSKIKFYVYFNAFLWQLPVVETFCAVFICFLPRANHNLTVHFLSCLHEHEDMFTVVQGGRSCTGARVAPAEEFGLGRKFLARTYAILSRIEICRDLRTFWRSLVKKSAFLGQKQCFLGKKCTITWYILHILLS